MLNLQFLLSICFCISFQCKSIQNYDDNSWKEFYKYFAKCDNIEVDRSIKFELVYFEVRINKAKIELTNFVGNSKDSPYLKKRIQHAIDCMDATILINNTSYHFIYMYDLIENKINTNEMLESRINRFKSYNGIDIQTHLYRVSYSEVLH